MIRNNAIARVRRYSRVSIENIRGIIGRPGDDFIQKELSVLETAADALPMHVRSCGIPVEL